MPSVEKQIPELAGLKVINRAENFLNSTSRVEKQIPELAGLKGRVVKLEC